MDEVVLGEVIDAIADQAAATAAVHDDCVRVLVALEGRVPTGCNLEVAQLRSERRVVEKNLAGDLSKRCAALGLVFTHLHFAPARWADLGTIGCRGHSDV